MRRLLDVAVFTLTAALSIVGLAAVAHMVLGYSFLVVATSSMEPEISAGSTMVVQEVDHEGIEVGDVVTAQTEHREVPVTHRVTEVHDDATVSMRGDANEAHDPWTYDVSEGALVYVDHLNGLSGLAWAVLGLLVFCLYAVLWWRFVRWVRSRMSDFSQRSEQARKDFEAASEMV